MRDSGDTLTRKQETAIAALMSEATVSAAAQKAKVSEATLYRWQNEPEFLAAYRRARRLAVEKSTAQLQQSAWAASTTLLKLLGSGNDSIRLRASQLILDYANNGVETLDFEERLEALEQFAKESDRR